MILSVSSCAFFDRHFVVALYLEMLNRNIKIGLHFFRVTAEIKVAPSKGKQCTATTGLGSCLSSKSNNWLGRSLKLPVICHVGR